MHLLDNDVMHVYNQNVQYEQNILGTCFTKENTL